MDKGKATPNDDGEGTPNRAAFHHGSTTQGGSDFGQGSSNLGKGSNAQGSESNDGANYENEKGWNNEALRSDDDPTPPATSNAGTGVKSPGLRDTDR